MEKKIILWSFTKKKKELIKNLIDKFMISYDSSKINILDWLIYNDNEGIMIIYNKIENIREYLLKYFDDIKVYNYEKINDWLN
jgi:hypothetical protein